MDFLQPFVASGSWGIDELIRLWGQKIEGQGHMFAQGWSYAVTVAD